MDSELMDRLMASGPTAEQWMSGGLSFVSGVLAGWLIKGVMRMALLVVALVGLTFAGADAMGWIEIKPGLMDSVMNSARSLVETAKPTAESMMASMRGFLDEHLAGVGGGFMAGLLVGWKIG